MSAFIRVMAGSILLAHAFTAAAQDARDEAHAASLETTPTQPHVAAMIASRYTRLAGSEENALALVHALHEGSAVKLVSEAGFEATPRVTTIDPPTGRLRWDDVTMALRLAQGALHRAGLNAPTAEQLHAALLGGEVRTAGGKAMRLPGVLQLRADGLGWAQIAQETVAAKAAE